MNIARLALDNIDRRRFDAGQTLETIQEFGVQRLSLAP